MVWKCLLIYLVTLCVCETIEKCFEHKEKEAYYKSKVEDKEN